MELINECSIRFAEDKDFRLLVGVMRLLAHLDYCEPFLRL